MQIIKTRNYKEMSKKGAEIIINEILKKPNITIGFATGFTPLRLYKELIKACKKKKVDFSRVKSFNLDEYYPIEKNSKKSFYYYMFKNLFSKVNIKKSNINLLNGEAKNPERECRNYEKKIKKNPIDIQILGVGINRHIAFNEPGSLISSRTRLVELKHKAVKKKVLTMGIFTIMKSKKIILLASGKSKAEVIRYLVKRKVNKECPVSFLKKKKVLI